MSETRRVLWIACGALGRELAELRRRSSEYIEIDCLPAELHNTPDRIPERVVAKLIQARDRFDRVVVAFADCGTGGRLDAVLSEFGVPRLPGAHCYECFAGREAFAAVHGDDPGTFYLTDFLVRHFERLVIRGLGLDRHPELLPDYFGNYRRVVYLAQTRDPDLEAAARACADRLGLVFEYRFTGLSKLELAVRADTVEPATWPS